MSTPIKVSLPTYAIETNDNNLKIAKIRDDFIANFKLNSIAKTMGLESIETRDKPFSFGYIGSKTNDEKIFILKEIAKRYYERLNIRNLLDINDYLLGITQSIFSGIKVNIIATTLMDLENVTVPLINAYNDDIVDNVANLIKTTSLSAKKVEIKVDDIQSYLSRILNAVRDNKSNIMVFVDKDVSMERFIEVEITRSLNCEVCILNKLLLAIYRNIMEILLNKDICDLDENSKLAIEKIRDAISPVSDGELRKRIDYIVSEAEAQTGVALEAFGSNVVKTIGNVISAIFSTIINMIGRFYKFIVSLFKRQINVKAQVEEQVTKLTPEEKQKAEDAGKPKFYSDPVNKKVYAFDKNDNYIVTMSMKSPNPFVRENKETVTTRIEENKSEIKPISSGLASLDDLIKTVISKSDSINKDIYNLIMAGKNPPTVIINVSKILYDYLNSGFNSDASSAMNQVKDGKDVFAIEGGSFTGLVKLLDEVNKELGLNPDRESSVVDYVRNTYRYIYESEETVKIDDSLIQKLKSEPINASYEEFAKYADRKAPSLRESIFNNPTDKDAQIAANKMLKIYNRLASIYKNIINQGVTYYQLVYIPLAMAHNIGEIGEKAAYLYAAKRKDANENN